jgi:hypothetical protein
MLGVRVLSSIEFRSQDVAGCHFVSSVYIDIGFSSTQERYSDAICRYFLP